VQAWIVVAVLVAALILSWQAYVFIERATRPEPAVVYVAKRMPRSDIAALLKVFLYAPLSKIGIILGENPSSNTGAVWEVDSAGRRKWILKEYDVASLSTALSRAPDTYLRRNGKRVLLFRERQTKSSKPESYHVLNLFTGEYSRCDAPPDGMSFLPDYLGDCDEDIIEVFDFSIGCSQFYRWNGDASGFSAIIWPALYSETASFITDKPTMIGSILMVFGNRVLATSTSKQVKLAHDLIFFDTINEKVIAKYTFPYETDSVDYTPFPLRTFDGLEASKFEVETRCSAVRTPSDGRTVLLFLESHISDPAGTLTADRQVLLDFDYLSGTGKAIPIPTDKIASAIGNAKPESLHFLCYNPKYDTSYFTIDSGSFTLIADAKAIGIRRDNTWSDVVTLPSNRCSTGRDGIMWFCQFTNSKKNSRRICNLVRYDPETCAQKTIHSADYISVIAVLN
jgi:hypothetical protein